MAIDEQLYDQIEQYLDRKMSKETHQSFEERLQNDPELAAEVQLHRDLGMAIQQEEADLAFRKNLRTIRNNRKASLRPLPRRRWMRIASAAAAVLVLLVALSYLFQSPTNPSQVADRYLDLPPISLTEKSANTESTLLKAEQFYKEQNFSAAAPLFRQYLENNPVSYDVQLYAGLAYLKSEQYPQALAAFDVILNSDALNRSEAQWYKALCLLKMDQLSAAQKLLQALSQSGSSNF
ncbi:MAG: hypothetical protein AAFP19_18060 [Bacteroidota bacterium]